MVCRSLIALLLLLCGCAGPAPPAPLSLDLYFRGKPVERATASTRRPLMPAPGEVLEVRMAGLGPEGYELRLACEGPGTNYGRSLSGDPPPPGDLIASGPAPTGRATLRLDAQQNAVYILTLRDRGTGRTVQGEYFVVASPE